MRQSYWAPAHPAGAASPLHTSIAAPARPHPISAVGALLTGVAGLVDSAFGVTAARRLAVHEHIAPVDDYLVQTDELIDKLTDAFGTWGPAALMTSDVRLRASRIINHEMVDRLAVPALRARDVAASIDPELTRRLDDAERVKLAIIGLFNTTAVGQSLTPLLRHLAEMRMMEARVSERTRQLQA